MYRIPKELDLSPVVGQFTTQLRVGQFDLQFTFGKVSFGIWSPVNLFRDGKLVAHWEEGKWPDAAIHARRKPSLDSVGAMFVARRSGCSVDR